MQTVSWNDFFSCSSLAEWRQAAGVFIAFQKDAGNVKINIPRVNLVSYFDQKG